MLVSYLHDGIIAGTETELYKASKFLTESRKESGLEFWKEKCELWSMESMTKVESLIKKKCVDQIDCLAGAILSDVFVSSCLQKRVNKLEEFLDNSTYVDDPQYALGILLFFAWFP